MKQPLFITISKNLLSERLQLKIYILRLMQQNEWSLHTFSLLFFNEISLTHVKIVEEATPEFNQLELNLKMKLMSTKVDRVKYPELYCPWIVVKLPTETMNDLPIDSRQRSIYSFKITSNAQNSGGRESEFDDILLPRLSHTLNLDDVQHQASVQSPLNLTRCSPLFLFIRPKTSISE